MNECPHNWLQITTLLDAFVCIDCGFQESTAHDDNKCDCGGTKLKQPGHSQWCSNYKHDQN